MLHVATMPYQFETLFLRQPGISGRREYSSWGNSQPRPSSVQYSRLGKPGRSKFYIPDSEDPFWDPVVPPNSDQSEAPLHYPTSRCPSRYESRHSSHSHMPEELFVDLTRDQESRVRDSLRRSHSDISRRGGYETSRNLSGDFRDSRSRLLHSDYVPSPSPRDIYLERTKWPVVRHIPIHVETSSQTKERSSPGNNGKYQKYLQDAMTKSLESESFERDYEQDLIDLNLRDSYVNSDMVDDIVTVRARDEPSSFLSSASSNPSWDRYCDNLESWDPYSSRGDNSSLGVQSVHSCHSSSSGSQPSSLCLSESDSSVNPYRDRNNNTKRLSGGGRDQEPDLEMDCPRSKAGSVSKKSKSSGHRESYAPFEDLMESEDNNKSSLSKSRGQGSSMSRENKLPSFQSSMQERRQKEMNSETVIIDLDDEFEEVISLQQKFPKFPVALEDNNSKCEKELGKSFQNVAGERKFLVGGKKSPEPQSYNYGGERDVLESVEQYYANRRAKTPIINREKERSPRQKQEEMDQQIALGCQKENSDLECLLRVDLPGNDWSEKYCIPERAQGPEDSEEEEELVMVGEEKMKVMPEAPRQGDRKTDKSCEESAFFSANKKDGKVTETSFTEPPNYPAYKIICKIISAFDGKVDYIKGDGNCFFRALSKVIYGSELCHEEVRHAILDLMERHPKEFEHLVDRETVREQVEAMRKVGTWATQAEIYGAATLLQRDVYVLSPDHTGERYHWLLFSLLFVTDNFSSCHRCHVTLCHTNGNHYDRIAVPGADCNCGIQRPSLDGIEAEVDLTDEIV